MHAGARCADLQHWKKPDAHLECHIVGHELAGEVVEGGPAVTNLQLGDRVGIETVIGECEWCRAMRNLSTVAGLRLLTVFPAGLLGDASPLTRLRRMEARRWFSDQS